jgi:hypothetical protein
MLLSGCLTAEPKTITITETVPVNIPIVNKPAKPDLISPKIYVVNKDNYEEFVSKFSKTNGELVFIAISIKDYENLSINLAEIQAYLKKQNEIIVYYEDAIQNNGKSE